MEPCNFPLKRVIHEDDFVRFFSEMATAQQPCSIQGTIKLGENIYEHGKLLPQ
jgi:hypothetical protein